ncbi:MAG: hypothetical protein GX326_01780 [Clostridiaceae bacterium]|nr:hypothetical protein [Clostridiaceae bacterium]
MKQFMTSLKVILFGFIIISLTLLTGIIFQQNKSQKLLLESSNENKHALAFRYSDAGTIYSREMTKLAYSENQQRKYSENPEVARSFVQIIGDYTHNIGNTIEAAYQDRLIGSGRPWHRQLVLDFTGKGMSGDDIALTISSELNLAAQNSLAGSAGSVVILNYETGEILCAVSTPNTYPENVVAWQNIPTSALFNRSFNSEYSPGSTFKVVTGTAWSKSNTYDPNYAMTCTGREPLLGPGSVFENRTGGSHGYINMQGAYEISCNHFFGDVGLKASFDNMEETAEEFGFNKEIRLGKLYAKTGEYQAVEDEYLLTWQAIGQPIDTNELSTSTLHLAMLGGAIANDGVMMQPYLINHFIDPSGNDYDYTEKEVFSEISSQADVSSIKNDLISTVNQGMASNASIYGYSVGGKTGTAESVNDTGELQVNSLYTGFIDDPQFPYAIGIVVENGHFDTPSIASNLLSLAMQIN